MTKKITKPAQPHTNIKLYLVNPYTWQSQPYFLFISKWNIARSGPTSNMQMFVSEKVINWNVIEITHTNRPYSIDALGL